MDIIGVGGGVGGGVGAGVGSSGGTVGAGEGGSLSIRGQYSLVGGPKSDCKNEKERTKKLRIISHFCGVQKLETNNHVHYLQI